MLTPLHRFVPPASLKLTLSLLAAGLLAVPLLYILMKQDYLFFHTFIEMAGIVVGMGAFMVVIILRDSDLSRPLAIMVGVSAGVAALDFLHTTTFAYFPIFHGRSAEHSLGFFILARVLEGAGGLVAVTLGLRPSKRPYRPAQRAAIVSLACVAVLTYALTIGDWLPRIHRPTTGMLPAGRALLWVATLLFLAGTAALLRGNARRQIGAAHTVLLISLFLTKVTYILMTLYGPPPSATAVATNMLWTHVLKLSGYVTLAATVLSICVVRPHQKLRDTRQRESSLRAAVQEHADTLTAVIGASLDYLVIHDLDGRFLVVSPSVARLFQIPVSHFTHATWRELALPPMQMRLYDGLRDDVVRSGVAVMQEGRLRLGRRTLDLEYQVAPIQDAQGRIQAVVTVARDITDRKNAERRLLASLEENQILLAEVHHRVKNNLQVVSSILQMQAWTATNTAVRHQFEDAVGRILALAKVHELLYQQNMFSRIDFGRYVESLCGEVAELTGTRRRQIQLVVDIEPLQLTVDRAAPLALIVHELVTNSLKHAFEEQGGTITIRFRFLPGKNGELSVIDDGCGVAPSVISESSSLGITMLRMLARQLRATLSWESDGGTCARLILPLTVPSAAAYAGRRARRAEPQDQIPTDARRLRGVRPNTQARA